MIYTVSNKFDAAAAEFSFLLAVPTLTAASLFSLYREPDLTGGDVTVLLAASAVAFVSGLAAVHWLMRLLRQGKLSWFAVYCGVIGGASMLVWGLDLL